jgi:uncharacterized protein
VHLSNIALRGNPGLIALQALGAFTGGIGMAAIRIRTRTIWTVIVLHALHDLFFQLGGLPVAMSDAINATVLMLYGIYLLRPAIRARLHGELAEKQVRMPANAGAPVD